MDENYLDSLLNEVSLDKEIDHKIEEELDSQMEKEKRQYQDQQLVSDEDLFNIDLELDAGDMQMDQDVRFSEEQMDELDRLDNLADLDIGDLDFSDIDFDDLDVTKLDDVETDDLGDLLKEFEGDLDIASLFESDKDMSAEKIEEKEEDSFIEDIEEYSDISTQDTDTVEQKADLNEDSFDADKFLDSLLDDTVDFDEPAKEEQVKDDDSLLQSMTEENSAKEEESGLTDLDEDLDLLQALEEFGGFESTPSKEESDDNAQLTEDENADLDDILSLLDLDGLSSGESNTASKDSPKEGSVSKSDLESELDDIEELPSSKPDKKQKIMEMLFGEQDEDDVLSYEELAQIEAKKAAKKEKKIAAKKAKKEKAKIAKEEKAAKSNLKKKESQEKKLNKAKKKSLIRAQELANAEPEKKLNKPMVLFIFTLFIGATFLFFVATNSFNYTQAIERAAKYFANQKYRKAYDEIVGVEVKEKDEELKDRIYTVMYVERLYEAYENNMELGRQEKALDSLLRGVSKYYEHYEEAETLGVASDMDYCFSQITTVLLEQYGITIEDAIEINRLDNYAYVQYIQAVVTEKENASGNADSMATDDTEAVPEEKKEEEEE